jgi:hypothetical protein
VTENHSSPAFHPSRSPALRAGAGGSQTETPVLPHTAASFLHSLRAYQRQATTWCSLIGLYLPSRNRLLPQCPTTCPSSRSREALTPRASTCLTCADNSREVKLAGTSSSCGAAGSIPVLLTGWTELHNPPPTTQMLDASPAVMSATPADVANEGEELLGPQGRIRRQFGQSSQTRTPGEGNGQRTLGPKPSTSNQRYSVVHPSSRRAASARTMRGISHCSGPGLSCRHESDPGSVCETAA